MGKIDKVEMDLSGTIWIEYLISFRLDMDARGLSPKTIEGYYECIGHWVKWLRGRRVADLTVVTKATFQEYILFQREKVSGSTINCRLRHVRGFLGYLHREGVLPDGVPDLSHLIKLVKVERGPKPVVGIEIVGKVLRGLVRRVSRKWDAYRDLCMVLVFWDCMVRLSELRGLRVSDVSFDQKTLQVLGKGRKRRVIPVGDRTLKALNKWVIRYRGSLSGGDWLFTDRSGTQLTARNIHQLMARLGKKQGVRFNPHLIRHSSATWFMSQQGANLEILRQILGHSSILVTQQYLHLNTAVSVEAYARNCPSKGLDF